MIEVSVTDGRVSVLGHACYAEKGKDIVCAGVTALVQALVKSIGGLTGDSPGYVAAPGVFSLELKDLSEGSKLLVDSFFIGLCGIADEFPDYVRIG